MKIKWRMLEKHEKIEQWDCYSGSKNYDPNLDTVNVKICFCNNLWFGQKAGKAMHQNKGVGGFWRPIHVDPVETKIEDISYE